MCGIVGCIGRGDIVAVLIAGLQRLEYRGYDSAGVCLRADGALHVTRRPGRIAALAAAFIPPTGTVMAGIAHTRWATHGAPTAANAHPHIDCTGAVAVVHNGIIENYHGLRELLTCEGHTFTSETDTEVAAHLVEKFYRGDLEAAVVAAVECIEGAFGLAVMHRAEDRIVIARRGSPLIIGVGDGTTYVASDAAAILEHTNRVVYIQDNEVAWLAGDGFRVHRLAGGTVAHEVIEIRWTVNEIEKRGYKHFMLKEIHEQPEAIGNTLRGRVTGDTVRISVDLAPNTIRRVLLTACGTSWHAALIGKHLIERLAGLPAEVDYASEFRYRDPVVGPGDLMVVLSQSGETADTLAALREAKSRGARTAGIVNVVGSTITREVDSGIYLHAGPEIGVASTKAFTCQIAALTLLALHLRQDRGRPIDPALLADLVGLPRLVAQALEASVAIAAVADELKDARNCLYLGRGFNFPVALEGALKLKEISYIHAEGYPAAEMKHGPIALIDADMLVVVVAPHGPIFDKIVSNMQEVKARGGRIVAVTDGDDPRIAALAEHIITVPAVREELQPVVNVIPLQLLAYHIADRKGLDVDKPRNLAKSVTVE
ncbi:MAG: glutamine--fructose-6-phosphate transaminase (isomerizing) [Planctomycetota bacterium]